jgi:hypothetical protein
MLWPWLGLGARDVTFAVTLLKPWGCVEFVVDMKGMLLKYGPNCICSKARRNLNMLQLPHSTAMTLSASCKALQMGATCLSK